MSDLSDVTITFTREEFNLIIGALLHYRLAGFPKGKSSYGNPISRRDRQAWRKLGMSVWDKVKK